ncbi:MAG: choice-of-anchor D domain-containing protein [Bacteroidales bacterium]|nr:choice-of-anchor D domain-containing protein [Bacteroidales bacterium]
MMRKITQTFLLNATLSLLLSLTVQVTHSQAFDHVSVEAVEDTMPDWYVQPDAPVFYSSQSALTGTERHTLDSLSSQERNQIEQEVSPPAIGVYRELQAPIQFDLSKVLIPASGEITVAGGRLTRIDNELVVWTTFIQSYKADELRIHFSEGYFPHGVSVNLFSENEQALNQSDLIGQIDEYGFYTTSVFSDNVLLQVVIPVDLIDEELYFTISGVIHTDRKYIILDQPEDCYEDARCSYANGYANIHILRGSTAQLTFLVGGLYYICTGGLLNDTRPGDLQPFLLTANHCFSSQTSAASLESRFDFYTLSCNGSTNTNTILINGSNLIATNSQSDFTLVLLKAKPGGTRYYLGWSTAAVSNNTTLHSVHHPSGTPQKYSRMQNKTSPGWTCTGLSTTNYHYTTKLGGQTLGGSSGAPIVNASAQAVGQLYGWCYLTADRCDFSEFYDVWGKFSVSYSNNNLQYWLNSGGSSVAMSTSPASALNFGTRNIGTSTTYNVNVYNTGTRPNYLNLEAGSASISGTNSSQFSIVGSSSLYLAPGESGVIQVRFSPTSNGYKTATLNIPHNADNISSPRTITLTGHGNPCSDAVNLNNGGVANTGIFSRSGTGSWHTSAASDCGFTCPGRERLFYFTAPYTGTYQLHVTSTNNTWVDYMYRSGSCSSTGWTCIDDVFSPGVYGSMSLTAGTTYYILLDSETTATTSHNFYIGTPGRWEGTGGSDWSTANNWYNGIVPDATTNVTIVSGKPNSPVIGGGNNAYCNNLVLSSGTLLTQNSTSYFYVNGNFDSDAGQFIMNGATSYLYFDGTSSTWWDDDNENDTYTHVRVLKDLPTTQVMMWQDMTCNGTFDVREGRFAIDASWTLTVNSSFSVESGGILRLAPGKTIDVAGGVRFLDGSQSDITGGTIRCGGNFRIDNNVSYDIAFTDATVILDGSGSQLIQDLDGNSIHHLTINKPSGTATIDQANLSISGNLIIENGTFSLGTWTCDVAGTTNINNGGTLAMNNAGNNFTTPVIFWNSGSNTNITAGTFNISNIWDFNEGTNAQIGTGNTAYINNMYFPEESTAHFGNLVVSPGGVLLSGDLRAIYPVNVAGNLTIKNGANWTFPGPSGMIVSGNSLIETGASLSFNSNAVFNTSGSLNISGTLNVNSGASSLLNGALIFPSTGLLSIADGSFINDLPDTDNWTYIHGTLNMSSGLFELSNNHPQFMATAATNISGGVFRIGGAFAVNNPGIFQPTGGTFEITGNNSNGAIYFNTGNNFHNLVVNRGPSAFSMFVTSDPVTIQNNFTIENGMFRTGSVAVSVQGNATINSNGILALDGVGSLLMGASQSLTVNNGGLLELNGTITDQPKISRISTGNYAFNIESGGTIGAEYALFEHMNTSGINIKPGAIVDPSKAFHYCTFRNGQSGGRLLTINNSQTFAVNYASFPNNTWGGNYNVYKTANSGVVNFGGFSGLFSGEANEWDPHSRVHWGGEIAPNVTLEGVEVGSGQDMCFEATNTLTVGGGGSTFLVQNGGSANLVAGQKVVMLDGTRVYSGGYLLARITTTADYCGLPPPILAVLEEKQSALETTPETVATETFFKVYPNPTTGRFTLELSEIASTVMVEIHGVMGEQILRQEVSGFMKYEFDLSSHPRGIYIIRVLNGDKMQIQRVIRQ